MTRSVVPLLVATFLVLFARRTIFATDIPVLSESNARDNTWDTVMKPTDDDDLMPKRRSMWEKLLHWDFSDDEAFSPLATPPTELSERTYLRENQKMEEFEAEYAAFASSDRKRTSDNSSRIGLIMWHGMGDSGLASGIQNFAKRIEMEVGDYVTTQTMVIGDSDAMDRFYSYFLPIASQIKIACPKLEQWSAEHNVTEWHAVGVSQGSQFLRAVVQQCGSIRISKLVSLGGQHAGIFGLPLCDPSVQNPHNSVLCNWIRSYLEMGAYISWIQSTVVQAQIWRDPHDFELYTKSCIWLPGVNNELYLNSTYVDRIAALDAMILIKFNYDRMVTPRESAHFEFYKLGSDQEITPLRESRLYTEDRLGLRVLDKTNRLNLLDVDGDHLRFTQEWFSENVIPLLKR